MNQHSLVQEKNEVLFKKQTTKRELQKLMRDIQSMNHKLNMANQKIQNEGILTEQITGIDMIKSREQTFATPLPVQPSIV